MSMLGTFLAFVAFAAKPRSTPAVDREAKFLHAARAGIEDPESANAELTVGRDAGRRVNKNLRAERDEACDRALEVGNAYRHARRRIVVLEERLALYEGRRPHPMSHVCCVPSRADLLKRTRG